MRWRPPTDSTPDLFAPPPLVSEEEQDRQDLRGILAQLRASRSRKLRDATLKSTKDHIHAILKRRPELMKDWLLALDKMNRKLLDIDPPPPKTGKVIYRGRGDAAKTTPRDQAAVNKD